MAVTQKKIVAAPSLVIADEVVGVHSGKQKNLTSVL
jgi:hypothetical protein